MLNNKSAMLKVLVLALSVLMLVSLAACNKNSGTSEEDMNNAIQSALAEASAAQSKKDAELQASIKAEQEKQDAAIQSSLAELQSQMSATTTTKTESTTSATTAKPKEDITAIQAELAKLKHEYTYAPAKGLYSTSSYTDLVLLFEKASVEMLNAMTTKDAQAILEKVKVDAAAIPSAKNAAAAVQAQIAALGDIEVDVFTTSATKVKEARKAFVAFLKEYKDYCDTKLDSDKEPDTWDKDIVKKLGIAEAELDKAEAKLSVLTGYIKTALVEDMKALYVASGKEVEFDEEGADLGLAVGTETAKDVIARAYYQYLILAAVNGGDVADAKVAIDWEFAVDKEGDYIKADGTDAYKDPWGETYAANKKTHDVKKPTAFFTAEQFINVYVTPYLNDQLAAEAAVAIQALSDKLIAGTTDAAVYTAVSAITSNFAANTNFVKDYVYNVAGDKKDYTGDFLVDFDDVEDALEDVFEAFEAEIEKLTFVGNYKGTKTMAQAKADIWAKWAEAYVKAGNEIIKASQAVVADKYAEYDELVADGLETYYDAKDEEKYAATYASKLADAAAYKAEFLAHAAAAPSFDKSVLTNKDLAKKLGYNVNDVKTPGAGNYNKIADVIAKVVASTITENFTATLKATTEAGMLGEFSLWLTEDLLALRDRLDPTNEDGADLYKANKGTLYTYRAEEAEKAGYIDGQYYSNAPAFLNLAKGIDTAITKINAVDESKYTDKEIVAVIPATITLADSSVYTVPAKYVGQPLYFATEGAKAQFIETYGSDNIENDALIMFANRKDNVADLVTTTKTDYPITFTYTASAQARVAAFDLYVDAYKTVNTKFIGWTASLNDTVKTFNNASNNKGLDAALKLAAGHTELTAEINALANVYADQVEAMTGPEPAFVGGMSTAYTYSEELGATHFEVTVENIAGNADKYVKAPTSTTALNTAMDNAYKAAAAEIMKEYNKAMFNKDSADVAVAADGANCTVLALWSFKRQAANDVTNALAQYKNVWTVGTKTENGVTTTVWTCAPANANVAPKYDENSTTGATASGKAYEAQLDSLFASYVSKIMAVTIGSTSEEIKAANGTTILAATKVVTVEDAKKVVNAYVADLLGDTDAAHADVAITGFVATGKVADTNSRIQKAYNVYYKNLFN